MRAAFLVCVSFLSLSAVALAADDEIQFSRDIRPLLSETCFHCHGPDDNTREADLELSTKNGLFGKGAEHAIIVPGKPMESELYRRLVTTDADTAMPPVDSGKSLTKQQIDLIRKWIERGAKWQGHWAYITPKRPVVPTVKKTPFVKNDIDRFILAKLNEKILKPSKSTDRAALIRRLSFDLTGLPPKRPDVIAFVKDKSPAAYENLVDRLLGQQEFGERMAMYWLDLARYADTNGIHGDNHRDVYLYRDYVISAFNNNKPFNQFTIEQLAGDLLEGNLMQNRIASGYNRMLMTTREGGAQAKEYLAKYASDRVRNTASAWLGSTMMCSECHNHKYDPFTMKDYYSFAAFFADLQETPVGKQQPIKIPKPAETAKIAELDKQIAPLKKTLATQTPELDIELARWETDLKNRKLEWTTIKPLEVKSKGGMEFQIAEDGSILAVGKTKPATDVYTVTLQTDQAAVTGIRLEVLPHDSLPSKGPGLAENGNLVLNKFVVTRAGKPVVLSIATATHSQTSYVIASAIDGKPNTGWAIIPNIGKETSAVFETKADIPAGKLTIKLHQNHGGTHNIGHFRISVSETARPIRAKGELGLPKNINDILAIESEKRTAPQKKLLADHFRTIAKSLKPTRDKLGGLEKQKKQTNDGMETMLVSTAIKPRAMRILPRGNWLDESGETTSPAVPSFLPQILGDSNKKDRLSRLDLANWMVAKDNPLTSRVFVNRLWKLFFGQGIVKSVDDFGAQGTLPTHPKLLDWLAVEFVENGWNVKDMIRLMVTSGAYRQSSFVSPELREQDPFNQWLARQGRFRLDAEMVRDNALAVSGLLVKKVGGRSVKPYQPAGYWKHLNFPKRVYKHDSGDNQYRRGLYAYWCRTFLHPSLRAFDAPTREECSVERPRSNTPLQALVLLNDPTYVEASRVFAERILNEAGKQSSQKIQFVYQQILGRNVRPEEVEILTALHRQHREHYAKEKQAVDEILTVGEKPVAKDIDRVELAAWTSIARVMFNLHETITRN